jgi:hypothetical protein
MNPALDPRNLADENQASTSFADDEFILASSLAGSRSNVMEMKLDPTEIYRKVFFFIEAILSTDGADFLVDCSIEFRRNGRTMARLPASIARDATSTLLPKSKPCISVGASTPVADSLRVCLGRKFAGGFDNIVLTPNRICCHADEVQLHIDQCRGSGAVTVTSVRAYLAVMSSNRPI